MSVKRVLNNEWQIKNLCIVDLIGACVVLPGVNFTNILSEQIFCTKVFCLCAAFLYLELGFEILWQKNISTKAARKICW